MTTQATAVDRATVRRVPGGRRRKPVGRHSLAGFLFTAPITSTAGGLYRIARDGSEQYISARARHLRAAGHWGRLDRFFGERAFSTDTNGRAPLGIAVG